MSCKRRGPPVYTPRVGERSEGSGLLGAATVAASLHGHLRPVLQGKTQILGRVLRHRGQIWVHLEAGPRDFMIGTVASPRQAWAASEHAPSDTFFL